MKYTFLGFSQQAIINLGLDDKEVVLLRWFVDFTAGNKKITKKIFNNEVYYEKNLSFYDNVRLLKEARLVDEYVEEMLFGALRNVELYEERIITKEDYFYDEIEIKRLADENLEKYMNL